MELTGRIVCPSKKSDRDTIEKLGANDAHFEQGVYPELVWTSKVDRKEEIYSMLSIMLWYHGKSQREIKQICAVLRTQMEGG